MAQAHFFLPLDKVCRRMRKMLDNEGTQLATSFISQRSEMSCRFVGLKQQPFFFESRPRGGDVCYRRIDLCAYLVAYKMYSNEEEDYFLVFGTSIDKAFEESYDTLEQGRQNHDFRRRVCTRFDLVCLQEALRGKSGEGPFYSVPGMRLDYRAWVNRCVEDIAGHPLGKAVLRFYIPEYVAIDVRAVYVDLDDCDNPCKLNELFTIAFFSDGKQSFDTCWKRDEDALLALCLLKGNGNMNNVSDRQIRKFRSHAFTNNKHEMMYVGQQGIVFLRTHHPFDSLRPGSSVVLKETMPDNLTGVQNVYELCTVLSIKRRLELLRDRLNECPDTYLRSVLARLAQMLDARLTNVVDLSNRYRFIYRQMHVYQDFRNLRQAGEMLSDAYQLKLSQRINRVVLLFTISAFVVAVLQVVQCHINSNHDIMNLISQFVPALSAGPCCRGTHAVPGCNSSCIGSGGDASLFSGDGMVMLCLVVLVATVALVLLLRFMLYPLLKELHRRWHREMDSRF